MGYLLLKFTQRGVNIILVGYYIQNFNSYIERIVAEKYVHFIGEDIRPLLKAPVYATFIYHIVVSAQQSD